MKEFFQDLQFGARMLLKGRLVSAIVVITLALGIGVTSTIVSLIGTVLVSPFPQIREPERVGWIFESRGDTDLARDGVPVANFVRWKQELAQLETMAALTEVRRTIEGSGGLERIRGYAVSAAYFRMLGVAPVAGRDFNDDEDTAGHEHVVIVGHQFAERRFGNALGAVGQTLALDGTNHAIIGVLSPRFAFPQAVDIWLPLVLTPEMRANHVDGDLVALGRIKAGATKESVDTELGAIAVRLAADYPETHRGVSAHVLNLPDVFIKEARAMGIATVVGALLTLVVASINVGNILLAQGTKRRSEIALRAALGASRMRIMRQLLTESLLLCSIGGALGCLVAIWGVDLFAASMPERVLERMRVFWDFQFDARCIAVAAGTTLFATLVAGLFPAWRLSETTLAETFKEQGTHATSGRSHRRALKILVTGQVAIALGLLTGAAWGTLRLIDVERSKLGVSPAGVLCGLVIHEKPGSTVFMRSEIDEPGGAKFFHDVATRLRAIPGVTTVGLTSAMPLERGFEEMKLGIPGRPKTAVGETPWASLSTVEGDYFATAGIAVEEGRTFDAKDEKDAPFVALLSRRAANRLFPNERALGKTLLLEERTPCTVVGIVDDVVVHHHAEVGMIYVPLAQRPRNAMYLLLRGSGEPSSYERPVRDAVRAVDAKQPVEEVMPLDMHVDEFLWGPRTIARLVAIPGALSMLLAVLGIYGVAAYSANQRRGELGIRAALGATPRQLVKLVMNEALWIAGVGATLGFALSSGLVIALARASDVQVLSIGGTLLLAATLFSVVLLASYGPARKAGRVPPSLAMRPS